MLPLLLVICSSHESSSRCYPYVTMGNVFTERRCRKSFVSPYSIAHLALLGSQLERAISLRISSFLFCSFGLEGFLIKHCYILLDNHGIVKSLLPLLLDYCCLRVKRLDPTLFIWRLFIWYAFLTCFSSRSVKILTLMAMQMFP
jgi:hypothetical protein